MLNGRKDREGQMARIERAAWVLEYTESPEARNSLEVFAKEGADARLREAADAALKRRDSARKGTTVLLNCLNAIASGPPVGIIGN